MTRAPQGPASEYVLRETDDGCMVWAVTPRGVDKIDFFSSIYLAEQAYPTATRGPLPSFRINEM